VIANTGGSPVPISVIWCIFEALASAACIMKDSHLPRDENVEDWDTIYHRDLNSLNSRCTFTKFD
jgi:hypothetical protein